MGLKGAVVEDINEEFDHHGVKGMRWGRHKSRNAYGRAYKKQIRSDARTYAKMAKTGTAKNAKQADLQKRMASNKQYAKNVKVRAAINQKKKSLALIAIPTAAIIVLPEALNFVDGFKSSSAAYKANAETVKKGRSLPKVWGLLDEHTLTKPGKSYGTSLPHFR